MQNYSINNNNYTTREEMHQGKKHLVIPVVMMTEGVHNGSHGAMYHSIDELGKFPGAWNGIPVSIQHPTTEYGAAVSANSPDIIDGAVVGRVYNTRVEKNKLKAEAWLDIDRLKQISPLAAAYLDNKQPLEVSLGMFTQDIAQSGEWQGEFYSAVATNHRPDHLALLPGGSGACSWLDGCGVRTNAALIKNKEGENKMIDEKHCCPEKVEMLIQDENSLFAEADRDWLLIQSEEIIEKLQPVIVEKEVIKENAPQGGVITREQAIQVLTGLSMGGGITKEQAIQVLKESVSDPAQFMTLLPADIKAQMEFGLSLYKEHTEKLIQHIMTNQASPVWAKEDLQKMSGDHLKKLAESIRARADYSLNGNAQTNKSQQMGEEKLLPPGL